MICELSVLGKIVNLLSFLLFFRMCIMYCILFFIVLNIIMFIYLFKTYKLHVNFQTVILWGGGVGW